MSEIQTGCYYVYVSATITLRYYGYFFPHVCLDMV